MIDPPSIQSMECLFPRYTLITKISKRSGKVRFLCSLDNCKHFTNSLAGWFNPTGKNISVNEIPEYFIQHAKNVGSIPKNILIAVQEALLCRQLNRVHYEITNGTKCEGHVGHLNPLSDILSSLRLTFLQAYFIDMLQKLES